MKEEINNQPRDIFPGQTRGKGENIVRHKTSRTINNPHNFREHVGGNNIHRNGRVGYTPEEAASKKQTIITGNKAVNDCHQPHPEVIGILLC